MRKRVLLLAVVLALLLALLAAPAWATGQPNVSCETSPGAHDTPGFGTAGFANAQSNYANQPNGNKNAVSQYDIACLRPSPSA